MKSTAARILVSLLVESEDQLRVQLTALHGTVGWVELRLDYAAAGAKHAAAEIDLTAVIAAFPQLRFVAAILLTSEGGFFDGSHQDRVAFLQQNAACGFQIIDLPLGSGTVELPRQVQRLVSWHQHTSASTSTTTTNPVAVLDDLLQQARAEAGLAGIIKLVSWADFAEQSLPAVALQKNHAQQDQLAQQAQQHRQPENTQRLLAFAQGPGGSASRVMSLLAGAPWIYSCWPGANTAPGQWDYRTLLQFLPADVGLHTAVMGVMGNPIEHSLSPFLWSTAFQQTQSDAVYLRFPVADASAFFATALSCGISALSVTTPWKQAAAAVVNNPPVSGAANFLQVQADTWQATNTDGIGALDALEDAGLATGERVLLIGAGGAARGVAIEALQRGYEVTVAARRAEQAQQLCESCATSAATLTATTLESVQQHDFHAVIQATTVGGFHNPGSPTPGQSPRAGALALDMIYHPLQTTWLQEAAAAGAVAIPGTAMLIHQMLEQLRLAAGIEADFATLDFALRKELQQRESVVLIGARACGKTSLGRALAARLGWHFIDADEELERRQQRSIAEWIAADEAGFRAAECNLLPELLALPRHVVALGGGAVDSPASVTLLKMASRVVFLDCPTPILLERQQLEPRPPLSSLPLAEEVELLLARRLPHYRECADFTLSSAADRTEIVERLVSSSVLKLFST